MSYTIEAFGDTVTVDPESLVTDEWSQVALLLAEYAISTGVEPDDEVKLACIALQVLRRHPARVHLRLADVVRIDQYAEQDEETARKVRTMPPEMAAQYLALVLEQAAG